MHPFDTLTNKKVSKPKPRKHFYGMKNGKLAEQIMKKYKDGVPANEMPALIAMITGEECHYEHIPSGVIDNLKKYYGLYPYNGGTNHCKGDGYFYTSLVKKYGNSLLEFAYKEKIKPAIDQMDAISRQL